MTKEQEIDPRHQVIIDTVAKLTEIGQKKEATELREKAAGLETFKQLDELHQYCLTMLDFIGR
ncbi:hypothetical protein SCREM2_gp77 [Synechococcus phage S-CREM2]|nr:hypothetical protein SCREM2_gp77 [Synechococcus phage S-CREM2]